MKNILFYLYCGNVKNTHKCREHGLRKHYVAITSTSSHQDMTSFTPSFRNKFETPLRYHPFFAKTTTTRYKKKKKGVAIPIAHVSLDMRMKPAFRIPQPPCPFSRTTAPRSKMANKRKCVAPRSRGGLWEATAGSLPPAVSQLLSWVIAEAAGISRWMTPRSPGKSQEGRQMRTWGTQSSSCRKERGAQSSSVPCPRPVRHLQPCSPLLSC